MMRIVCGLLFTLLFPTWAVGQALPATYPPEIDRGSYYLEFTSADSTEYPEPPSLEPSSPEEPNPVDDLDFLHPPRDRDRVGGVWTVTLTNGDTAYVDPKAHASTPYVSFSFLNYYPEHELLLFRARQNEYQRYALVSRGSGEVALAFGPPVFSPSGTWFVTMGPDNVSGWRPKGLQLFRVSPEALTEIIHFRTGQTSFRRGREARMIELGGPTRCRWVDDDTFRLEMVDVRPQSGVSDVYSHYRVDVRTTAYHRELTR